MEEITKEQKEQQVPINDKRNRAAQLVGAACSQLLCCYTITMAIEYWFMCTCNMKAGADHARDA